MICTATEIIAQIKACVKPHQQLTYIGFTRSEDCLLNPVFVLIYQDAKGVQFARQAHERFVLPIRTYRREILGDLIDNSEELKEKPATNYFMNAGKKEFCSVLNSIVK